MGAGNKNYYKFVFDWNMYKTGSISESLTFQPPIADEKYPCQNQRNGQSGVEDRDKTFG